MMRARIAKSMICLLFLASTACAEDAATPVAPRNPTPGPEKSEDAVSQQVMALTFKCQYPVDEKCLVHVVGVQTEVDGEPQVEIIAKADFLVHGMTPLDTTVAFGRFDDDRKFQPIDSGVDGAPVLMSATLRDRDSVADLNFLKDYEEDFQLLQSVRMDLYENIDASLFKDSLLAVMEDNSKLAENKANLDMVKGVDVKVFHEAAGHYDSARYFAFELQDTMTEVTVSLDGEIVVSDDGDEDGAHNHDHGDGDHDDGNHDDDDHDDNNHGDHDHDHDDHGGHDH